MFFLEADDIGTVKKADAPSVGEFGRVEFITMGLKLMQLHAMIESLPKEDLEKFLYYLDVAAAEGPLPEESNLNVDVPKLMHSYRTTANAIIEAREKMDGLSFA